MGHYPSHDIARNAAHSWHSMITMFPRPPMGSWFPNERRGHENIGIPLSVRPTSSRYLEGVLSVASVVDAGTSPW